MSGTKCHPCPRTLSSPPSKPAAQRDVSTRWLSFPPSTIGHSTRGIAQFVELLRLAEVWLVADIRSVPRSRTNPQYNLDMLPAELADYQIGHIHNAELGGLRKRA